MNIISKIIPAFLLLLAVHDLTAQDPVFNHFTVKEGLSSSQVYETFEDDFGFIWFLSDKGVMRFNGFEFETFTQEDGLSENVFYESFRGQRGSVWLLGANSTLTRIIGSKPKFNCFEFNAITNLERELIPKNFAVSEGEGVFITYHSTNKFLQISTKGEILENVHPLLDTMFLQTLEKRGFNLFYLDVSRKPEKQLEWPVNGSPRTYGFYSDYHQKFVVSNEYELGIIPLNNKEIKLVFEEKIIGLGPLNKDNFWVSFAQGGVKTFDFEGNKIKHLLSQKSVSYLYEDRNKALWATTLSDGIYQTRNPEIFLLQLETALGMHVTSLETDDLKNLYFTTFEGDVYKRMDGRLHQLYKSKHKRKSQILFDKNERCTIITTSEGILRNGKLVPYPKGMATGGNELFQLKSGVGMCLYGGFAVLVQNKIEISSLNSRVQGGVEYNDTIWLATNKGLYFKKDDLTKDEFNVSPLFSKRIEDIKIIGDLLLLGTYGSGIVIIQKDRIAATLGKSELGSGFINKLYVDNEGSLWICTSGGLCLIQKDKNRPKYNLHSLNYGDGLLSNEVNDVVIIDDTVWVATTAGICFFSKEIMSRQTENKYDYHLQIKEVLVNDDLNGTHNRTFAHNQNRFYFQFGAINLKPHQQIQYRYKLIGAESIWNYSIERQALYPNLSPDEYKFQVQVKGGNRSWEFQTANYSFIIRPPYWRTWWFISAISVAFISLVYLFFKYRILLYNKDLVREILRQILKKIKKETLFIIVKENGKEVKIASKSIYYIKSQGNYLEIHHELGKTLIRKKIGEFMSVVPDPIEFIRIRRSFIVRIDKIEVKGKKEIVVAGTTIQVGNTYMEELSKILL